MTHWPPNSCMPSSAKTTIKRKRRNNRLMIDFMELSRDTTRFLKEFQYLHTHTYEYIHKYCGTTSTSIQTDISDDSLGDFEDPEQSQSPQDTDPKWGPRFDGSPDHLKNTANNHLWTQQATTVFFSKYSISFFAILAIIEHFSEAPVLNHLNYSIHAHTLKTKVNWLNTKLNKGLFQKAGSTNSESNPELGADQRWDWKLRVFSGSRTADWSLINSEYVHSELSACVTTIKSHHQWSSDTTIHHGNRQENKVVSHHTTAVRSSNTCWWWAWAHFFKKKQHSGKAENGT